MEKAVRKVLCLTPVYDDWDSFTILINNIRQQFQNDNFSVEVIAVNDNSNQEFDIAAFPADIPIEVVSLKKNVGHQRAIAIGLQYIFSTDRPYDFIVVMDSDGEDMPEHIKDLVSKCMAVNETRIVFAKRKKRKESFVFKTGYFFYKYFFYMLTGQKISFGNYSCIPRRFLKKIVYNENLWNHYSGCIIQSKIPFDTVLLDRGIRYRGKSKMNFTSLVLHGLSSIAVYFDYLSVRILKLSLYSIVLCFIGVLYIFYLKFFTDSSIPGWASNLLLIILSIILQFSSVTLIVLLMQLSARKNINVPSATVFNTFIESIISNHTTYEAAQLDKE
jgi:hypothetical protein